MGTIYSGCRAHTLKGRGNNRATPLDLIACTYRDLARVYTKTFLR